MPSGSVSMGELHGPPTAQSSLGPGLLSVEGLLDRESIMGECVYCPYLSPLSVASD